LSLYKKLLLIIISLLFIAYMAAVIILGSYMPRTWYAEVKGSQFAEFENGVMRYSEIGDGPSAIVFLHGFGSQINTWNEVWSKLNDCHHAIRVDIPGFGYSQWNTETYTLDIQAERIHQFLKSKNIQDITLVGASMGASLSATFAARYPHLVNSLVLIAPSAYPGSLNYRKPFTNLIGTRWFIPTASWVAKTWIYKKLYPDSIALQSLTLNSSYNQKWVDALKTIFTPTVLMWSKGDNKAKFEYATLVSAALPNDRLVILPEEVHHNAPFKESSNIAKLACTFATDHNRDQNFVKIVDQVYPPK